MGVLLRNEYTDSVIASMIAEKTREIETLQLELALRREPTINQGFIKRYIKEEYLKTAEILVGDDISNLLDDLEHVTMELFNEVPIKNWDRCDATGKDPDDRCSRRRRLQAYLSDLKHCLQRRISD